LPINPSQTPEPAFSLAIGEAGDGEARFEDRSILSRAGGALSVRLAYGTFFAVQAVAGVCHLVASRLSPEGGDAFIFLSFPTVVALGAIFTVARDLSAESGLGANIAIMFWFHNLVSLACSIYKVTGALRGNGLYLQSRGFEFIMSVLYLFWVICGTAAVLKSSKGRAQ
jgi:hypothetical protein